MNYELSLIFGDGFINAVCNIVTVSTHFPSTLKKACNEGLQGSYPRICLRCDVVLQKVPSEDDPEVRNHGEGPY